MKFFLFFLIISVIWIVYGLFTSSATKQVSYDIVQNFGKVEIRQYNDLNTIRVIGDDRAFSPLFNYIAGNNQDNSKIAMTAPVITDDESMVFILPEDLDLPPLPNDNRVNSEKIQSRQIAAIRFSGYTSDQRTSKYLKVLRETLKENNIQAVGKPFLMRYNDPWTIPFLRRNEVAVEISQT